MNMPWTNRSIVGFGCVTFASFFLATVLLAHAQEKDPFQDPRPSVEQLRAIEIRREQFRDIEIRRNEAARQQENPVERVPPKARPPLVLRNLPSENEVTFYNESFKRQFEAFDTQFKQGREELSVGSFTEQGVDLTTAKQKVRCCLELAELPDNYRFGGTTTRFLPEKDYLDCFALAVTRFGKRSKQSFFKHDRLAGDIFKSIKVGYLSSNLTKIPPIEPETMLKEIPFSAVQIDKALIELRDSWGDDNGTTLRIEVLASADFDEDGFEDVLIMSSDQTWKGSYLWQHPLVICRKSAGGELEVKKHEFLLTCLRSCRPLKPSDAVKMKETKD
ncbi:MAG: hypothetical protein V4719_08160 [Planctomycetota bacterium]